MVRVDLPTEANQTQRTATLDVTVKEDSTTLLGAPATTINAFSTETTAAFLNRLKLPTLINNFQDFLAELNHTNVRKDRPFPTTTEGTQITDYLNVFSSGYGTTLTPASQLTYLRNVRDGVQQKYANESDTILTQLNQKKKDLDEAKTRYEAIKDPEQKVGYYEGWFPIFRPMRESSLFGVFGAGLFLLLISIFMFLNMNGVSVSVELPVAGGFELPDFSMAGPWAIGGLVVGGVGAYLLYKYT